MITKLRGRSQITLPNEIIREMALKAGDNLEITIEDDKIIVRPVLIVDRAQAWFWSKEWQEKETEADRDKKEGRVKRAKDVNDLARQLEKD